MQAPLDSRTVGVVAASSLLLIASACGGCGGGGGGGGDDDDRPPPPTGESACVTGEGLGEWTGNDNVAPAQMPPCGIAPGDAPVFASIGWDDNGDAAGMTWALDMLKAKELKNTFFMTSSYGQSPAVVDTWKRAHEEGHEIGNHTVTHLPNNGGRDFTADQWRAEIGPASEFLSGSAGVVPTSASRWAARSSRTGSGSTWASRPS